MVFKPSVPRKWKSSIIGELLRYTASGRTVPKFIGRPSPLVLSALDAWRLLATGIHQYMIVTIARKAYHGHSYPLESRAIYHISPFQSPPKV
jgi:hypothetical protein